MAGQGGQLGQLSDQAGRDHMTRLDGLLAKFDHEAARLRLLQSGSGS